MIVRKYIKIGLAFFLVISMADIASAIKVKDTGPFHFSIRTPKEIEREKVFKATIVAWDNQNRLIRNYNSIGSDVHITTTGNGIILPGIVSAAGFKKGKAVVYFTYSDTDEFEIVARPIEKKALQGEYLVNRGDVMEISVWEAEGLTKEVIVTPDGMLSFPLIGEVSAFGKTLRELDEEVTSLITAYVRNPQVSIMVKKIGGRRVIVLGEVRAPGVYELQGEGTVMEAIAMAGGATKDAITRSVAVVRGDLKASPEVKLLNLDRAITYGQIPRDYVLKPQDIVYVPTKFIASFAHFFNQFLPELYTVPLFVGTPLFKK